MVTLATTEGLGTFWIAARLNSFMRENPRIVVDLHCAMLPADVLRMEADVAVQLERPMQKDVKLVKLGRMHLMPYVSPSYAARNGLPKLGPDLARHPVIVQAAEQLVPVDEYAKTLGGKDRLGPVAMRSNISGTHYFAIATGAGFRPAADLLLGAGRDGDPAGSQFLRPSRHLACVPSRRRRESRACAS